MKGVKKVKKTRTYTDAKGYMVIEEYSSTEEIPIERSKEVNNKQETKKKIVSQVPKQTSKA